MVIKKSTSKKIPEVVLEESDLSSIDGDDDYEMALKSDESENEDEKDEEYVEDIVEEIYSVRDKLDIVFPDMKDDEINLLVDNIHRIGDSILYDVVGMVKNHGITYTMDFLVDVATVYDFHFKNPVYDDVIKRANIEKDLLRNKPLSAGIGIKKCPKCGSNETSYVQKQMRRSDEPMTNLYTCLSPGCGKRW